MSTSTTLAKLKQHGGFRTKRTATVKRRAAKTKAAEERQAKTRRRGKKLQVRLSCGRFGKRPKRLTRKYANTRPRRKTKGEDPQGKRTKRDRRTKAKVVPKEETEEITIRARREIAKTKERAKEKEQEKATMKKKTAARATLAMREDKAVPI